MKELKNNKKMIRWNIKVEEESGRKFEFDLNEDGTVGDIVGVGGNEDPQVSEVNIMQDITKMLNTSKYSKIEFKRTQ